MACQRGVFLAYGSERHGRDDFELDLEEYKSLQSLTKSTGRRVFPTALMTMSVKPVRKFCGSAEQLSRKLLAEITYFLIVEKFSLAR